MKKITLICDRCGKEFKNLINEKRTVTISCNYGYPGLGEQYDLCSECYKEFSGWWNQESAVIGFEDVNKIIGHLDCDNSVTIACELRRLINGNKDTDTE